MKGWRDLGEIDGIFVYEDFIGLRGEGWYWTDFDDEARGPYKTYEEAREARLAFVESIREEPLLS